MPADYGHVLKNLNLNFEEIEECDFRDLLDELFHLAYTDFFRKKSKLHVLFQSPNTRTRVRD